MPGRTSRLWPATSSSAGSRMPGRITRERRIRRTREDLEDGQRQALLLAGVHASRAHRQITVDVRVRCFLCTTSRTLPDAALVCLAAAPILDYRICYSH